MEQADVVKIILPRLLRRNLPFRFDSLAVGLDYKGEKYYAATDSLTDVYLDIKGIFETIAYSVGRRLSILMLHPPACNRPISEFAVGGTELWIQFSNKGQYDFMGGIQLHVSFEGVDHQVFCPYCSIGGCECYNTTHEPLQSIIQKFESAIQDQIKHAIPKRYQIWVINGNEVRYDQLGDPTIIILLLQCKELTLKYDNIASLLFNVPNLETSDVRMLQLWEAFQREGINSEHIFRQLRERDLDRLGLTIGEKVIFREYLGLNENLPMNIMARDNVQIMVRNNHIVGNTNINMQRVVNNVIMQSESDTDETEQEMMI